MNKELIQEIQEISKALSKKYQCHVELVPLVNKISLEKLYRIVNDEFKRWCVRNGKSKAIYKKEGIRSRSRRHEVKLFRQIFIHIGREMKYSLEKIGTFIDRDHSTCTVQYRQIVKRLKKHEEWATTNYNIIQTRITYAPFN